MSASVRDADRATNAETDATAPLLTVTGSRADIRLNRPRHVNRIEPDDIAALRGHLERLETDRSIRVVVLTGTGRAFSSGYHLGDLGDRIVAAKAAADPPLPSPFEALVDQLENLRVPTICAFNGSVYGGSTDLALACDFRIGIVGMEMFMPAARLGLHYYPYYPSGNARYVSRLGLGAAKKLFLTGARIGADEMLRVGFLDELVPPEGLAPAVDALAATLAAQAPLALEGMKRAMNEFARAEFDRSAALVRHRASLESEDVREGARALREKRPPVFAGR